MTLQLKDAAAFLLAKAEFGADEVVELSGTSRLERNGDAEDGWLNVKVVDGQGLNATGFIPRDAVVEAAPEPPPTDIAKQAFFDMLDAAAREYGAPRDYLFAVANLETGIRNIVSGTSSARGPFQFLPSTWAGIVGSPQGAATGFMNAGIDDVGAQAAFAAIYTASNMRAAAALGQSPTHVELYLMHLLGQAGGLAAMQGAGGDPVKASPARIAANSGLLQTAGATATLDQVRANVADGLAPGFAMAERFAPAGDAVATVAPGAEPAWLGTAREQLALGVKEDPAGRSSPEVDKFFKATTSPGLTGASAWCAAFVAWCLANCDDAAAAASHPKSARAADWLTWASPVDPPRVGSLAVTVPLAVGSSGHVGFLLSATPTTVTLLSGNWGEAVAIGQIARSRVLQFRDLPA